MAEDFGVEDRRSFYDPVGALRDVAGLISGKCAGSCE
jgi:hypothetical protein